MDLRDRDWSRGFLPADDPLVRLAEPFREWEEVARDLSKLALSTSLRPTLEHLPPFPVTELHTPQEYERAMTMLSFMANLYVFAPDHPIVTRIPKQLAVAWYEVATHLGRPPMLTYASQTLHNWRRIDPQGPIAVGNLAMIQNFLGGMDEEWFVTVHVNIEAEAGRGLSVLLPAQEAVIQEDTRALAGHLLDLAVTWIIKAMSVGEDSDTIIDIDPPYFLQISFLDRTPWGGWLLDSLMSTWAGLMRTKVRGNSSQGRL